MRTEEEEMTVHKLRREASEETNLLTLDLGLPASRAGRKYISVI